ncbi:universal stress protein [Falsibacillus pallidus]|uniref:Nucleotide-binding universal stress UspA family protein n=1 Tax=Falsibacillus pallidus TaxID=493781 RepID=A0A370GWI5_9BACI|nr:universal stress protein [Falsibacillus pallidus]RDI47911.1 nucleotide-binding universal stress UspA family protein [Falsibacillus pallidus]
MISHIMVAYDGSDGSKKALEEAMAVYDRSGMQRFTVAHVFHETVSEVASEDKLANMDTMITPRVDGIYAAHMPLSQDEKVTQTHEVVHNSADQIVADARYAMETRGIHGDVEILEGSPAEALCEYAESSGVDLIVVGNSGHSGIKKFFVGSVSEKVVKHSHCPVLVAK